MIPNKLVKVIFSTKSFATRYNKKYNTTYTYNDMAYVDYNTLKDSPIRRNKIPVICDICGKTFEKRICDIDKYDKHYCRSCTVKGERNHNYKIKFTQEQRAAISKRVTGKNNPFYGKKHSEETRKKMSDKVRAHIMQYGPLITFTDAIKKKISEKLKLSYANGKHQLNPTYCKPGYYKGIYYIGTYELDFLQHIDNMNLLHNISKGPTIKYFDIEKNKQRLYIPDFFIKELNLILEIKSSYTLKKELQTNMCKKDAAIEKGYDFLFIVNKQYTELDKKLKIL